MSDNVTIKCRWCGGEFSMQKSDLAGKMDAGIQMCFDDQFAVFSGKKQITGEVIVKVTPFECDICERCALAIASGTVDGMLVDRGIDVDKVMRLG